MGLWQQRRRAFRAVMAGQACVHPASVFDPLSARIAEDIGFEVGMFAGSTASLTVLGAPDNITLTLSEFAAQARRITRASQLPIMVDADHGYGNALNVARTVEELDVAGICGLSIEDTNLPEPFASAGAASMVSLDEGVGKMRAAVAGRHDPELVIAARTSAVAIAGVEEAVRRVTAYQETGVDALFLIGVKTPEQLDAIAKVAKLPLILGGVPAAMMDRAALAEKGVRICLQGHHTIPAAVRAIHETLTALRNGTAPADLTNQPARETMARLTRADDCTAMRNAFLGADTAV